VHSMVTRVIPLESGDAVSYGGTWVAPENTRGALIPIGYADGYLRSLSNKGSMGIEGLNAPVIGRVCMDQTIVHMPDSLPSETRQRVVVIGDGTDSTQGAPNLEQIAEAADTIPHEFMTTLAHRVPKLYIQNS